MNSRNVLLVASVAIMAAGFGVAWNHACTVRETESALAALAQRRADTAANIRRLESRLATNEKDRADLRAALDEAKKAGPVVVAPPPPTKVPAGAPGSFNPMEAIMKDPKLQNYFFASQRAELARSYGPFFRQLGLTPTQVARFQDLMIKRAEQDMDLQAVAQSQGLSPGSPALVTLRKQAEDELRSAQTALLGPTGYEQWQQYERTVGVRPVVQKFVGAAALEALPLTAQQAEQLTQILAEASPRYAKGGKANFSEVDWTVADRRLAGVFSETQLKLFQQIEPMGGGPSRFGARLNTTFEQAVKEEKTSASAPATKPPGG